MELVSKLLLLLGPYLQVSRGDGLPLLWGNPQREPITLPMTLASLKEDEPVLQVMPIPMGPSEAIAGPLGSPTLPVGLPGGLPVPSHH